VSIDFTQKAKAKQLKDYFQTSGRIYIVVDGTADAVDIPQYLKGDPALRLALNVRMAQPIYIRDTGVSSVLSFSGKAHDCFIPLQCIWGAYEPDGDLESGLIWEDVVPDVIRAALIEQASIEKPRETAPVTLDDKEKVLHEVPHQPKKDPIQARPTKAPHLRVVK